MHSNCLIRLLFLALLAFAAPLWATPLPLPQSGGSSDGESSGTKRDLFSNTHSFLNNICDAPIIGHLLCPPNGFLANITIPTPIGQARGFAGNPRVVRFAVKYANAGRWQASTVATAWELP